ncbi:hypothetical protein O6H91_02G149300 [Diphasiastrum complanatum]|uniref:Uncharacterized protein n=1 Tax=Diphasiastrum complanatum TaxID=34168 RepID=A0ACC2ELW0_DIPCM|nr:hypothetical protein O6H91_02G149300 [Diphasiastrum complanatum]
MKQVLLVVLFFFLNGLAFAILVTQPSLNLSYHNGPILSRDPLEVHILFYGSFSHSQKAIVRAFLSSISTPTKAKDVFTVQKWWSITRGYVDLSGSVVAQNVEISGESTDVYYRLGKILTTSNLTSLVLQYLQNSAASPNSLHLVVTAADVFVEGFCQDVCGQHLYTYPTVETNWKMLPYAWVGNAESQCPTFCAWRYAKSKYGSPTKPLKAPNGVGMDGLIFTLANVLVGVVTNPFQNAYYQGDASVVVEAVGACMDKHALGFDPSYPDKILKANKTGASYNVHGIRSYKFLVPFIWNPQTHSCAIQP